MKKEEFDRKIIEIEKKSNDDKRILARQYAISNNPYKIGDVIEDHYHIIKIEKWTVRGTVSNPSLLYQGVVLKKDLTPKKNQDDAIMYQTNVERQIKKSNS
jgi:hypothetical protein